MRQGISQIFFAAVAIYSVSRCGASNSAVKGGKNDTSASNLSSQFYRADLTEAEAFLSKIRQYSHKEMSCFPPDAETNPYHSAQAKHGKSPTSKTENSSVEPSQIYLFASEFDSKGEKFPVIEIKGARHVFHNSRTNAEVDEINSAEELGLTNGFSLGEPKKSLNAEDFGKVVGYAYLLKEHPELDYVYGSKLGQATIKIKGQIKTKVYVIEESSQGQGLNYSLLFVQGNPGAHLPSSDGKDYKEKEE